MKNNTKTNYIIPALFLLLMLFGLTVLNLILPKKDYIDSERRPSAKMPEFNKETIFDGSFTKDFEKYTTDNFVFRDTFREIKARINYDILQRRENNDIFRKDNSLMKLEKELSEKDIKSATDKFQSIYDKFIAPKGCKVYAVTVPDKAYFPWRDGEGLPSLDYDRLFELVKEGMPYAEHIDVTSELSLSDFYLTDTHWRQEKIIPVAKKISEAMGNKFDSEFEVVKADVEFRGVNSGHSAITSLYDDLYYLTNATIENCKTVNLEKKFTDKNYDESAERVYNMEKLASKDPYEVFLSGACAAITMENPSNPDGKELVIFRDSYGSSIAPLLLEDYSKITLLDIRYMNRDFIGSFANFDNADVLFLYSTTLMNYSAALR